jgi:hypothetical protein
MKTIAHKNTAGFAAFIIVIIIGVLLGVMSFFAVRNVHLRGSKEVTATVRVADGTSEDEIFMASIPITKKISARSIIANRAEYILKTAKISDTESVSFDGCTLAGIYDPVKCTATNGKGYWITLTEIK